MCAQVVDKSREMYTRTIYYFICTTYIPLNHPHIRCRDHPPADDADDADDEGACERKVLHCTRVREQRNGQPLTFNVISNGRGRLRWISASPHRHIDDPTMRATPVVLMRKNVIHACRRHGMFEMFECTREPSETVKHIIIMCRIFYAASTTINHVKVCQ